MINENLCLVLNELSWNFNIAVKEECLQKWITAGRR